MNCVNDYLVTKKSSLTSKEKALTRYLEDIIVAFVKSNYKSFEVEVSLCHLLRHMKGLFRLHTSKCLRIMKREMCHNVTDGGKVVKAIVNLVFEMDFVVLRDEQCMQQSGSESLLYGTGFAETAA